MFAMKLSTIANHFELFKDNTMSTITEHFLVSQFSIDTPNGSVINPRIRQHKRSNYLSCPNCSSPVEHDHGKTFVCECGASIVTYGNSLRITIDQDNIIQKVQQEPEIVVKPAFGARLIRAFRYVFLEVQP